MLQVVKCYFRCAKTEVEMGVGNVGDDREDDVEERGGDANCDFRAGHVRCQALDPPIGARWLSCGASWSQF